MNKKFDEFYKNLKTLCEEKMSSAWEEAKKENKKANTVFLILAGIIDAAIIYMMSPTIKENFIGLFPCLVTCMMADIFLYAIVTVCFSKKRKQYTKMFKENVINELLSNFYNRVVYLPESQMPSNVYDEAQYKEYYNRYYSDDYMEAKIDKKYDIKMAEVKTVHVERHRTSDGKTRTTTTVKFHGMFAKIDLNKSINNDLLIRDNGGANHKERLEMDSEEFEKYFDVSSKDKIVGMQILTHDIMEMLLDFRKNNRFRFDISIYNNIMYLRFKTGEMFELKSIKKGAFDEELIRSYYNILEFIDTLSDKIIQVIEETEI